MKNIVRGLIVLACLATTASAVQQLRVGDSAELFVTGRLGVRFDDNIFLADLDERTDTVFDIAPGLEFTFGQGALTTGSFTYVESITRFVDNDSLNRELSALAFKADYDDTKVKFGVEATFKQLNENTRDVRGPFIVRRDVSALALDAELQATQKTSVGLGLSFDRTDFKRSGYIDIDETGVPVNVYYHLSPKVDVSAGVRYRESTLSGGGSNSTDYFYNLGARGDFTPKLTGRFNIGFDQRRRSRGGNESLVGVDSSFDFLATEKTTVRVGIGNDFGTSAEGESQKNFSLDASVITQFSPQWQGSVGTTYQKIKYFAGRTDDYISGQINVEYVVSSNVKLGVGYNYRKNDSDYTYTELPSGRRRSADFANNVLSFVAEIRY